MTRFLAGLNAAMITVGILTSPAAAEVTTYTNEAAYLTALAERGFVPAQEGFESDAVWGGVRSTVAGGQHTAPSVTHLGVTWSSSSANNGVTTSPGAAYRGDWGFYSLPHGDYANGITDGWRGVAAQPLVAIGGWVRTNTPFAALIVFLDGNEQNPFDFDGDNILGTGPYRFFGVIDTAGFSAFDFRETEGTIGDQKFIFGDAFTFAFGGVIQDCNENGMIDAFDITSGASADCNNNIVPDGCEIDANSSAPGGPFFCTSGCAADCNDNGVLDACEAVTPVSYASGVLSPIGQGSPQSFTIASAPETRADVIMHFTAHANLGGGPDHLDVSINGVGVGAVFGQDGSDCPEMGPDEARLIVPMSAFNNAVNGGDAVIDLVATIEVDPEGCDEPTFVTVDVTLFVPSADDTDGDGILDECACPADVDGDVAVSFADLLRVLAAWGPCNACPEDIDRDGEVGFNDLLGVLSGWGPCEPGAGR